MILQLVILDNGISIFLNRTWNSITNQITPQVFCETLDFTMFWSVDRNRLCVNADYVLFVYGGSILKENALEQICKTLEKYKPAWLYFDEKTYSAEKLNDPHGFFQKPDFDAFAFVQDVYTGEGVVFSRHLLEQMQLKYSGGNFTAAITEMTIAAAMQADPFHLGEMLLIRHDRIPLNASEYLLLSEQLKTYLHACISDNLLSYEKEDEVGLNINVVPQNGALSVVLLGNSVSRLQNLDADIEQIVVPANLPYWEQCLLGAQTATHDLLCFVATDYVESSNEVLNALRNYASLPGIGMVSPNIKNGDQILYTGNCVSAGEVYSITTKHPCDKLLRNSVFSVHQTALPSWQYWMISRDLFLDIMDKLKASSTIDKLSRHYFMMEVAYQVRDNGRKNLYIGTVTANCRKKYEDKDCNGFSEMIFKYHDLFWQDPYFSTNLLIFSQLNKIQNTKTIKTWTAYFPENLQPYNPESSKILILSHELSLTGAPIVLKHAVHILKEENIEVVVLSPMDGPLRDAFLGEQVPVIIREDMDEDDSWLHWAKAFDMVLVNTVVPFRQIQQLEKTQIPVMWWLHDAKGGYRDYLRYVLPKTVSKNIHIYSVSKYADDAMKAYRPRYKSGLLFYGLEDQANQKMAPLIKIDGAEAKKVFINVGTVIHRKGQDILVEAIRHLPHDVRSKSLFLFIGKCIDDDIFECIKKLEHDFPENIRQIDSVPHEAIFGLYRQADAVICSSRDDPLPTFMAETMMLSGVCICSENTGTASVIQHGINGFLYHNDSPEELAQCIIDVFESNALDNIKVESRKCFEKYFTMDIFKKNIINCIENCIGHSFKGV